MFRDKSNDQTGLAPDQVRYFREEEKGAIFTWMIVKLMLVHCHYFYLLEFVDLIKTQWGRLGLISESKRMWDFNFFNCKSYSSITSYAQSKPYNF